MVVYCIYHKEKQKATGKCDCGSNNIAFLISRAGDGKGERSQQKKKGRMQGEYDPFIAPGNRRHGWWL